ncbi:Lrp/AsnC family transcriptional regulator [Candidatus Woesearchaeota archaeon]|nr:Lrp/AsnC family transcriptional regulator [Candidatus Woesearchaeota archaeon]
MKYVQQTPAPKKVELDKTDRKILIHLASNVRLPAASIGRRIGLSKDTVSYRIANLKKKGVLQGSRTIVDIAKFGYFSTHLLLQLNQPLPDAEKKLIKTFQNYDFVRAIIKFNGKYDFELAVVHKTLLELDSIIQIIMRTSSPYLQSMETLFITKPITGRIFPKNFLPEKDIVLQKQKQTELEADNIDMKILKTIANHGDIPLHELGMKVGLSADGAKYRLKKLQQAGIIKGFVPVINYDVIGYNVYAILLSIKEFDSKREATLQEFLNSNNDILWGVKAIGKYNVLLYICTTNPDDLVKTTTALRSHFAGLISEYETLINYEEYKYTYYLDAIEN